MIEVEACMATYVWFVQLRTYNSSLLTTVQMIYHCGGEPE